MCQLERLVANTAALAALSAGRVNCSRKWPNGEKGRNKGGQTKVPKNLGVTKKQSHEWQKLAALAVAAVAASSAI
jgi:hypothetical protein